MRSASSSSRWSVTTGAGRLAGPRRFAQRSAARPGSRSSTRRTRSIFQKSLIEDADQRAASPIYQRLQDAGLREAAIAAMGFRDLLRKDLRAPRRPRQDPARRRSSDISPTGRQPGALDARCSIGTAPPRWWCRRQGSPCPLPDLAACAPFPRSQGPDARDLGRCATRRSSRSSSTGSTALVDDLTIVRLPDAGHFAPWEAPEAVAAALGPFLAGVRRG